MNKFEELYEDQNLGTMDLKDITLALQMEAAEVMNELDWKYWKSKKVDMNKVKEEISDVFIFLMCLAKASGMTANEFLENTLKKHNYNKVRPDHDRISYDKE